MSNSKEVLAVIPPEDCASEIYFDNGQLPSVKTLGIVWKAEEDAFSFTSSSRESSEKHTKRTFLSMIASVFDPMGMLVPFVIRAKMLLQEVWLAGQAWNVELPEELARKVDAGRAELERVSQIRVPRCLRPKGEITNISLHVFSDASENAYASVVYLRAEASDATVTIRQVVSKSNVAPLKTASIPRLELLGAVLSARIAPSIAKTLGIDGKSISYWSDSKNVLWWISRRSRTLKTFVANRGAIIQQLSNTLQWRYVGTKENPVDISTRGMKIDELAANTFW